MTEQEVRLCIQTLINLKLIDLTRIDGKWRIEINVDEFGKYLTIPMERVIEHDGYKMADKVEYEAVEENKPSSIEDMSDDDLKKLLLRIEASLSERQQVKELVKTNVPNGLPFQDMQKRYQYWSKEGIRWTEWFNYDGEKYPYQLGKKLKNEYR